jgi:hypothetical protein
MKPVAWIKKRELLYMQAVQEYGKNDWQTNLGLKPEPDDEGLYTETQVQKLRESFEQSVTDPENQPSQYGTVLMEQVEKLEAKDIMDDWSVQLAQAVWNYGEAMRELERLRSEK